MSAYKTTYFGDVFINEANVFNDETTETIELEYGKQKILIRFTHFGNCTLENDFECDVPDWLSEEMFRQTYIKECVTKIDEYFKIDKKTREFFIEWYPKDEIVRGYFKNFFDHFTEDQMLKTFGVKKLNESTINVIVEKMDYPNICFDYDCGHIITCVDYKVSALFDETFIGAEMDDSLYIISTGYSSF